MGKLLAKIASSSNPGKKYNIVEGKDGVVYCGCWAWRKNRTCKHLDRYHAWKEKQGHPDKNLEDTIKEVIASLK